MFEMVSWTIFTSNHNNCTMPTVKAAIVEMGCNND